MFIRISFPIANSAFKENAFRFGFASMNEKEFEHVILFVKQHFMTNKVY